MQLNGYAAAGDIADTVATITDHFCKPDENI